MGAWSSTPGWRGVGAESPRTRDIHTGMSMPAPGKGKGGGNPSNSWKHKDHTLGFWAWDGVCGPLDPLRAPWLGPPGYGSLPSPTWSPAQIPVPWVHLRQGTTSRLIGWVFFIPEPSKESPWLATTDSFPCLGGKIRCCTSLGGCFLLGQHQEGWEGAFPSSHLSKLSHCAG